MKMNKKQIHTKHAPQAIGTYSQAIAVNGLVFISGQIPLTADGELKVSCFSEQSEQVIANLKVICKEAGGSLDHIVKMTVLLTDLSHFSELNEIMAKHFSEPYPARAAFEVSALPKGVGLEIEAVMTESQ